MGTIRLAGIESESTLDGEGWRYVIFTQGCIHDCPGCHNPQSHDFNSGDEVEVDKLIEDIASKPFLDGVTFSGGDPFFQADKLIPICEYCKENGLTMWAYTGYIFDEFLSFINNKTHESHINQAMIDFLRYIDVVVDGPFILSKRSLDLQYRGSSNQRLVDVQQSLQKGVVIEYNAK